jgi:hypothetical protein
LTEELVLVDLENVQQIDLSRLDEGCRVLIFVGASQRAIPYELVSSAQRLGPRVEWQKVEGNGSNALDFHIACHLGRVLEKTPDVRCTVLSKDKGFDPLLRYLGKLGLRCRRINSLLELDPKSAPTEDPRYARVVELLSKSDKKARPRKLKTLSQHIASMFQKNIAQEEVDRIIDMLFAAKMISETNNTISYDF